MADDVPLPPARPDIVDVPNVDGVPPVLFAQSAGENIVALVADVLGMTSFSNLLGPQWGIFKGGAPVVVADTVVGFEYRGDAIISTYPVEKGGFASYDKVQMPYSIRLRFTAGSSSGRSSILARLEALRKDLKLYDAVTPDAVYTNLNIIRYDYRRTAQSGLGLLQVDVMCEEVRETGTAAFTGTAAPSGAAQVNDGTVQPQEPSNQSALFSLFN